MKSLQQLARKTGDVVSVVEYGKLWNAIIDHVIMRRAEVTGDSGNIALLHPWRVTFEEGEPEADVAVWELSIRPGWVNDTPAGVVVKEKGKEEFVQLQDEPVLFLRAELAAATWVNTGHGILAPVYKGWKNVDNLARPRAFATEEEWENDLYETHVFAVARNNRWECEIGYSAKLARLEDSISRIPRFEFCRLYMTRHAETGELALYIQNRVFWNVGAGSQKKQLPFTQPPPPVVGFGGLPLTYSFANMFESFLDDFFERLDQGDEFNDLIEANIAAQSDYNTIQIWTC